MATNEILPFAGSATGTDILSQSSYNSDSQRTVGHQAGVARRELINKSLKQTSIISAGIGKFLADNQSTNITDTLTDSQISEIIEASISSRISRATNTVFLSDYATLQDAVNAAGDFGKVILPENTIITISSTVTLREGITIEGSGITSNVTNTNNSVFAFQYLTASSSDFKQAPKFINFKINSKFGVNLNDNTKNPPFAGGTEQGFLMNGRFIDMFFTAYASSGTAIRATILFDSQISGCVIDGDFNYAIDLLGCDINTIACNRIVQSRVAHIRTRSTFTFGSQNLILGNDLLNLAIGGSGTSLIISSDRHGKIIENYFETGGTFSPKIESIIRIEAGLNGTEPITQTITGNRLDCPAEIFTYSFKIDSNPGTLNVNNNTITLANKPPLYIAVEPTYYEDVYNRRNWYVRDQAYMSFPFCTSYDKSQPPGYAYVFDPSRAGPITSDIGIAMKLRDNAFVIDNNSTLHHFDSFQQGGQSGFTATITFIARAETASTSISIQERNSQVGGSGLNFKSLAIGTDKAKYTYLTATKISDNFELLILNAGANDVLIYSIMVEQVKPVIPEFSPINISGLQLWLDASDVILKSDGSEATLVTDTVTYWPDKSGKQRAPTVSGSPKVGSINGVKAIQFNGNSLFTTPQFIDATYDTSGITIIIVATHNVGTVSSTQVLAGFLTPGFWFEVNSTKDSSGAAGSITSFTPNANRGTLDGVYVMGFDVVNHYSVYGLSNSVAQDNNGTMTASTYEMRKTIGGTVGFSASPGDGLNIGALGSSSYNWDGLVGEVLVYNRLLTNTETMAISSHLQAKWKFDLPQIVCLGDSLTAGTGVGVGATQSQITGTTNYPNRLKAKYGGGDVVNVRTDSFPGRQMYQIINQTDDDRLHNNLFNLYSSKRKVLIVWSGTNDLATLNTGSGCFDMLVSICNKAKLKGWEIVVCTCIPRGDAGIAVGYEAARLVYNQLIRDNYNNFADMLLDLANISELTNPNNATYFDSDKIHLISAGYQKVADAAYSLIGTMA